LPRAGPIEDTFHVVWRIAVPGLGNYGFEAQLAEGELGCVGVAPPRTSSPSRKPKPFFVILANKQAERQKSVLGVILLEPATVKRIKVKVWVPVAVEFKKESSLP
jgi:hypothetical protein